MLDYKKLQEDLLITLDYDLMNEEQFGIMLASGDLTDIVCPRQRFIPAIIENNLAMDLEPIIDSHIPNLRLSTFKYANELAKMFMGGPDNKLFFLAVCIGPENPRGDSQGRGYALRWDLYKELGYPEINSDADYIRIMQDMRALEPQTPEGLPTYAMGLINPSTMFQEWHQRGAYIREGTTGNFWTFNGYLYAGSYKDMTLINGYTHPQSFHWIDMKFFNNLYNLGLLDPDSFTMARGERGDKMNAGQYHGHVVSENGYYNTQRLLDPNTLRAIVCVPSRNATMPNNKLIPAGGMPTDSVFLWSGSRNWEAAAEVLNFYRDPEVLRMKYNGQQGVEWDYDASGKPFLTDKGIETRLAFNPGTLEHRQMTGVTRTMWDWTPVNGTSIHPDGYFYALDLEFEYRAMVLNPVHRDMAAWMGVDAPWKWFNDRIAEGYTTDSTYDYAQLVAMGCVNIPTDILRIMNNVNEITIRSIPGLVRASTQAEFDRLQAAYLAEIASAGENAAWEWCLNAYNTAYAAVTPIFLEARAATDALLGPRGIYVPVPGWLR
jgi:hypothetical protein